MKDKMKRLTWVVILPVIFLAQACQAQDTPSVLPKTQTLENTQQVEVRATESHTNTATPPATRTPSPSPSPTTTPTEIEKMQVIQLEVIDWESSEIDLTGSIVFCGDYVAPLNPEIDQLDQDSVILNLETKERIVLAKAGEDPIFVYDVSPNRQWLAYKVLEPKSEIVVTASDGQEAARFPMEKDWGVNGFLWLNNETITTSKSLPRPDIRENTKGFAGTLALVLYNPFTGENSVLLPDYPGIFNLDYHLDWYLSVILPDPTLHYLVYRNDDYENPFVLWDIQENEEVLSFPYGYALKWSPDGRAMVYVREALPDKLSNELYMVDLQGELTRLTTLNDKFSDVVIPYFQWSPDGKQIVFWFYSYNDYVTTPLIIGVVNVENGNLKVYESKERYEGPFPNYLARRLDQSPIWSPDSSKLMVVGINPDDENQRDILVIDLETDTMVKIAENLIPVGWMK